MIFQRLPRWWRARSQKTAKNAATNKTAKTPAAAGDHDPIALMIVGMK